MPPFRIVVITDTHKTATTVITEFDRSPDVGETIELPHNQRLNPARESISGLRLFGSARTRTPDRPAPSG